MAHSKEPILVDTNAIIEAYRVKGWSALTRSYRIETVEDCVEEALTGFRHRSAEQQIDARELRSSLTKIHVVKNKKRADFVLRTQGIALDRGEESLWAHALGRDEPWVLCGPDKASMRVGIRLRYRERPVSLESILNDIGHRPRVPLREACTKKWLRMALNELATQEAFDSE